MARLGPPLGNQNAVRGTQINKVLLEEARRDRWDLVRKAVREQLRQAAAGSLASTAWVFDRLAGRPMPMLPEGEVDGRAFSVTWSFGPSAIDATPQPSSNQALTIDPAVQQDELVDR